MFGGNKLSPRGEKKTTKKKKKQNKTALFWSILNFFQGTSLLSTWLTQYYNNK